MSNLYEESLKEISQAKTLQDLDNIRSTYLGIGSKLNESIKSVGSLATITERKHYADLIIEARGNIQTALDDKRKEIQTTLINNQKG